MALVRKAGRARKLGWAFGLAAGLTFTAETMRAQPPAGDRGSRASRVDASRLTGGQFVYQTTLERDASTTVLGTRTVSVTQAMYAGSPEWLLLEVRAGDAIAGVDSLFGDLTSLRPIHWGSTIGKARLSVEFRADTAYGGTVGPAGRRSMVNGMPSGTLVNSAMLETVLRLLPLQGAWEDSTATLSVSLSGATVLPTRISVIGEDRVRVPAGEFDCWVVSVHAGDTARGLYWVTKRDPIVVRSALDVPTLGGAQLVNALTRIGR